MEPDCLETVEAASQRIRGTAGYSARWRARFTAQPFRTRDFSLYSPLCLALGVGFIALSRARRAEP